MTKYLNCILNSVFLAANIYVSIMYIISLVIGSFVTFKVPIERGLTLFIYKILEFILKLMLPYQELIFLPFIIICIVILEFSLKNHIKINGFSFYKTTKYTLAILKKIIIITSLSLSLFVTLHAKGYI